MLIINDASTDSTPAVAGELVRADPRVSLVSHGHNRGHIRTYNEGLEWAEADYCMLLSADDLLVPGALCRAVSVLDEFPDVVLTHGTWIEWNGCPPVPDAGEQQDYTWTLQDGIEFIDACCVSGENFVRTPTVVVRTSVQKLVGGYSVELPHSGDMEMWMRFAARGMIASTDAVQAIYRKHSSNMSSSYCFDYVERKAAFDAFFLQNVDRVPDLGAMHEQANRTLAERAFWTGASQMCQGNLKRGRRLLSFAVSLSPELRYRPPLRRIAQTPDLYRRVPRLLKDSCENLLRSAGRRVGVIGMPGNSSASHSGGAD